MAGENGGGTFLLIYIICVCLIGFPLMMTEVIIGRHGRLSPVNSLKAVALVSNKDPRWRYLGGMGMFTGFLIFSFYSVVAAWILHYLLALLTGRIADVGVDQATRYFGELLLNTEVLLVGHTFFVCLVVWVLSFGVRRGLDRAIRYMMPVLIMLLIMLVVYATSTGYMPHAIAFLFHFDWYYVTTEVLLVAMGHAFFTLSLGMGTVMAYGAYLSEKESIGHSVIMIGALDTLIAILVGLAIFPIVFAYQMAPASGPSLLFVTLPVVFAQMPGGQVIGFMFFLMVALTAWSSAISLMEPITAWMIEKFRVKRYQAAVLMGFAAWVLGVATLYSFGALSHWTVFSLNLFDLLNFVTTNLLLPLGGMLLAIFSGWFMSESVAKKELNLPSNGVFEIWQGCIRFIVPSAIGVIFVMNLYNVTL